MNVSGIFPDGLDRSLEEVEGISEDEILKGKIVVRFPERLDSVDLNHLLESGFVVRLLGFIRWRIGVRDMAVGDVNKIFIPLSIRKKHSSRY